MQGLVARGLTFEEIWIVDVNYRPYSLGVIKHQRKMCQI